MSKHILVCCCLLSGTCAAQTTEVVHPSIAIIGSPTQSVRPTIAIIEEKPKRTHTSKLWVISCVALIAATSFDAASSWGKYEGNPLLRSSDGRFGAKGLMIKSAVAGGSLAPQILLRKRRKMERVLTIANFVQAGWYMGVGIHNIGVPQPK
jgi:hypothetical protein